MPPITVKRMRYPERIFICNDLLSNIQMGINSVLPIQNLMGECDTRLISGRNSPLYGTYG